MSVSTSPVTQTSTMHTAQNLIGLSQDIAALLSLSIESGASLINDVYRRTLGTLGLGDVVEYRTSANGSPQAAGERNMAVVVVGAGEPSGRALSLRLAKAGYTVFAIMPLPSPLSPPTSTSLSALLLAWSRIQKRVKTRQPNHPGSIVPVITDPDSEEASFSDTKAKGRYAHAGDTIRAYCHEQRLLLIAVICAARTVRASSQIDLPSPKLAPVKCRAKVKFVDQMDTPSNDSCPLISTGMDLYSFKLPLVRPLAPGSLALTDEKTLLAMYRANIVEPLAIIRELRDLLAFSPLSGNGRSRIVFVNNEIGGGFADLGVQKRTTADEVSGGAMKIIASARAEAAKLLRSDLTTTGIDVCEVLVGPMAPRVSHPGYHLRQNSDESTESEKSARKAIQTSGGNGEIAKTDDRVEHDVIDQSIALISRIWAVDDALLFSAVRRAIEDRYPRYRHHAGLSPLIGTIAEITPGAGIVKMIGRWIVRRLFMPRP